MKKVIKVCVCVMTAVIILTCNVFADSWAEETPYFSNYTEAFFPENITSEQSAEALIDCMENAYSMGLFGGSVPIACISRNIDGVYGIVIICTNTTTYDESGLQIEKAEDYAEITTEYGTTSITTSMGQWTNLYALLSNGDISVGEANVFTYPLQTPYDKLLITKNQSGEWTYDKTSDLYAQYYNVDNSKNQTLATLAEKYENAYNKTIIQVEYVLDIPSIITAIPNGAKQIINNAFGFEIFGINIAGLLSVILVVAIVAFVAKWLMSR